METRNSGGRGIQQVDVWSAADSLIKDGLRPTIERVRQKMGRGSPNTVSPMLEAWFATLGTRLGVREENKDLSAVPQALQEAMQTTWTLALSKGREEAVLETVQAKAEMADAAQALRQREVDLQQLEAIREAKYKALEEALEVANKATEEARQQAASFQEMARRRETELDGLQARLASVEAERDKERLSNQEAAAAYIRERQKAEERTQATQRKLLEEVDRARQETKKISNESQASERQFILEKTLLEEKVRSHERDVIKAEMLHVAKSSELEALQQAVVVSETASNELHSLLKAQLTDSTKAVARLTEALRTDSHRTVEQKGLLVRKLNRTGFIRKK